MKKRYLIFTTTILIFFLTASQAFAKTVWLSEEQIERLYPEGSQISRSEISRVAECEGLQEVLLLAGKYSINRYFVNWIYPKEIPDRTFYRVIFLENGNICVYHFLAGKDKGESYFIEL